MRLKDGFVVREVGGQTVVIATGEASKNFHGMVKLNGTAKEIWQGVADGLDASEIVRRLTDKYRIDADTVARDVEQIIAKMTEAGFTEP